MAKEKTPKILEIKDVEAVEGIDNITIKRTNVGRDLFLKLGDLPGVYLKQRSYGLALKMRGEEKDMWSITRIENENDLVEKLKSIAVAKPPEEKPAEKKKVESKPKTGKNTVVGNRKFDANGNLVTPKKAKPKKEE